MKNLCKLWKTNTRRSSPNRRWDFHLVTTEFWPGRLWNKPDAWDSSLRSGFSTAEQKLNWNNLLVQKKLKQTEILLQAKSSKRWTWSIGHLPPPFRSFILYAPLSSSLSLSPEVLPFSWKWNALKALLFDVHHEKRYIQYNLIQYNTCQ